MKESEETRGEWKERGEEQAGGPWHRKRWAGTGERKRERERDEQLHRENTDHPCFRFSVRSLKGEVTCGLLLLLHKRLNRYH